MRLKSKINLNEYIYYNIPESNRIQVTSAVHSHDLLNSTCAWEYRRINNRYEVVGIYVPSTEDASLIALLSGGRLWK